MKLKDTIKAGLGLAFGSRIERAIVDNFSQIVSIAVVIFFVCFVLLKTWFIGLYLNATTIFSGEVVELPKLKDGSFVVTYENKTEPDVLVTVLDGRERAYAEIHGDYVIRPVFDAIDVPFSSSYVWSNDIAWDTVIVNKSESKKISEFNKEAIKRMKAYEQCFEKDVNCTAEFEMPERDFEVIEEIDLISYENIVGELSSWVYKNCYNNSKGCEMKGEVIYDKTFGSIMTGYTWERKI